MELVANEIKKNCGSMHRASARRILFDLLRNCTLQPMLAKSGGNNQSGGLSGAKESGHNFKAVLSCFAVDQALGSLR